MTELTLNTSPSPAPAAEPSRILVVDDDASNRDSLTRRLARRGYETVAAADGREALDLLAAGAFDLVLLDVMMPGMSGLEVLERVRRTLDPTELPVVMATARSDSADVVEALAAGANDYVTKPIDFPVVLARVQTQLSLGRSFAQVRRLERELARRNADLEAANARLQTAADRARRELELAARVQETYLPHNLPPTPGLRFAWAFRPCDQLAGDALNICPLGEGRVGVYVLDVSGHGVAASLLSVAATRALAPGPGGDSLLVRGPGQAPVPPAEVAGLLDQKFPFNPATEQFLTFFYALVDAPARELTYVSAGHPGAVHVRRGGQVNILDHSGTPIGLGEEYEQRTLPLEPGDRVYLYSDGVTEAVGPRDEWFGKDRLAQALAASAGADLETSLSRLLDELDRWRGGLPAKDDVSVLAVECE